MCKLDFIQASIPYVCLSWSLMDQGDNLQDRIIDKTSALYQLIEETNAECDNSATVEVIKKMSVTQNF